MSADLAALQTAHDNHADATNNPHVVTAAQTGAIPANQKGAASGVATLDASGRLPMSQVPAALLYDLGYFASLSALTTAYPTAQPGNYARVAMTEAHDAIYIYDAEYGWIASGGDGLVTSVNGKTGAVSLNAADVGAAAAAHGHSDATTTTAGFMTGAMVSKLDGIAAGAAALGSATPQPIGTGAAGTATEAARADHVHPYIRHYVYSALSLMSAGADWAVAAPAPVDSSSGFPFRAFAKAADSGVGIFIETRASTTQIAITLRYALSAAPSSSVAAVLKTQRQVYGGAWSSAATLATLTIADAAEHEITLYRTPAQLGIAAGGSALIEIARDTANAADTAAQDLRLWYVRVEVN